MPQLGSHDREKDIPHRAGPENLVQLRWLLGGASLSSSGVHPVSEVLVCLQSLDISFLFSIDVY